MARTCIILPAPLSRNTTRAQTGIEKAKSVQFRGRYEMAQDVTRLLALMSTGGMAPLSSPTYLALVRAAHRLSHLVLSLEQKGSFPCAP